MRAEKTKAGCRLPAWVCANQPLRCSLAEKSAARFKLYHSIRSADNANKAR